MSKKDTEKKSLDRYVCSVTSIELAEKVRQELVWCTKSILSVYVYFYSDDPEESRDYDIHVANERGGYLDDTRYFFACDVADRALGKKD